MKKILVLMAIFLLLPAGMVSAREPVGPAGLLKKGDWSVGLVGTYLNQQKFKDYTLRRDIDGAGSDQERKSAEFKDDVFSMAQVSYGLTDWANLYLRLGMASGGKWHDRDLAAGDEWEAKLKSNFVWALGAKARVWSLPQGPGVMLGAQYLRYDDRKVENWRNTTRGYDADSYWNTDDKLDYWQVDLQASLYWPLGAVTPWAGLIFSHAEADLTGRWNGLTSLSYDSTMKTKDDLGAAWGLDWLINQHWMLNLSGVLAARTSVSLGLRYLF